MHGRGHTGLKLPGYMRPTESALASAARVENLTCWAAGWPPPPPLAPLIVGLFWLCIRALLTLLHTTGLPRLAWRARAPTQGRRCPMSGVPCRYRAFWGA